MIKDGLIEDIPVNVIFGVDDYLKPTIVEVSKATISASNKGEKI